MQLYFKQNYRFNILIKNQEKGITLYGQDKKFYKCNGTYN